MKRIIGQPQFLKEINVEQLEKLIYENGPISKPELAVKTGLSLPTVNKLVGVLEAENKIRSIGLMGTGAGRKASVYVANEQSGCYVIYYYKNKKFIGCIANMLGEITHTSHEPYEASSTLDTLAFITAGIENLMKETVSQVKAIGIGVPGAVKSDHQITSISSLPQLEGVKLKEHLEAHFSIPTFVENDVKLTTLGYYHQHLKDKYADAVYLFLGQGLGSGLIVNGKLLKGTTHFAGEIGYMPVLEDMNGDHAIPRGGSLEYHIQKAIQAERTEDVVALIGQAMANLICTLNPEVLVMGGEHVTPAVIHGVNDVIARYIPADDRPTLLHDETGKSGIEGAINLCISSISSSIQIVRGKGV